VPGTLFHVGAAAICPHGGPVSTISQNTRVLVSGLPVATVADNYLIAGCVFSTAAGPHPCVTVRWLVPSLRVRVNGQPAILQTSTGLCQAPDQLPQGPPTVITTQPRVSAQ
jgi:uncharacterized Zn-binding protein involved in type VI secretion